MPESEEHEPTAAEIRDEFYPFDPSFENLATLIALMDSAEVGVTLHVGGAVVSGLLISPRRYFKLLIHEIESSVATNSEDAAPTVQGFADFFRPTLASFEESIEAYRNSDKVPPRPHHVHLRHVQTFVSQEPLPQRLWRGRITEVSAWSIGNFGGPAPELPQELW